MVLFQNPKFRILFTALSILSFVLTSYLLTSSFATRARLDPKVEGWLLSPLAFDKHKNELKKSGRALRVYVGSSQTLSGIIPNFERNDPKDEFVLAAVGGTFLHSYFLFEEFLKDESEAELFFEISPRMFSSNNEKNEYALRYLSTASSVFQNFIWMNSSERIQILRSFGRSVDFFNQKLEDQRRKEDLHWKNRGASYGIPKRVELPIHIAQTVGQPDPFSEFLDKVYQTELKAYQVGPLFQKLLDRILDQIKYGRKIHFLEFPYTKAMDHVYTEQIKEEYQRKVRNRILEEGGSIFQLEAPSPETEAAFFYKDQTHPTQAGAAFFTRQIRQDILPRKSTRPNQWIAKHCRIDQPFLETFNVERRKKLSQENGKILFLGDSHIEGLPIARYFHRQNIINRGFPGETVTGLLHRIANLKISEDKIEEVILQIGVNDLVSCGDSWQSVSQRHQILIERLLEHFPSATINILEPFPLSNSTPPSLKKYARTSFEKTNIELQKLNAALVRAYHGKRRLRYLSLHDVLFDTNVRELKSAFNYDGIHLNLLGYDEISALSNQKLPPPKVLRLQKGGSPLRFLLQDNNSQSIDFQKTEVSLRLLSNWDLEVTFRVEDKSDRPFGEKNGDPIWRGDLVAMFIQNGRPPFGKYDEIEINSKRIQYLARHLNEGSNLKFEHYQVMSLQTLPQGWQITWKISRELIWPRGAEGRSRKIPINFYRIDFNENGERTLQAWSPTYQETFHVPERFGLLEIE